VLENWIEKTTANDILEPLTEELGINLVPASGTQSITAAIRLLQRCRKHGKPGHVLYISDYDKAGRHMPRAVARHLEFYRARYFPDVQVSLEQIALTEQQVEDLDLPRSPDDGESVELDALEALHPGMLEQLVRDAVRPYQDSALPHDLDSSRRAACVLPRKPLSRSRQVRDHDKTSCKCIFMPRISAAGAHTGPLIEMRQSSFSVA
jgi:hypothetical protein